MTPERLAELERERDGARAQVAALREALNEAADGWPRPNKYDTLLSATAAAARAHDERIWREATEAQREAASKLVTHPSMPLDADELEIATRLELMPLVPPPTAAEPQREGAE